MSKAFCWLAIIVVTAVFWVGLLMIAERWPIVGLAIVGLVIYAIIATVHEAGGESDPSELL